MMFSGMSSLLVDVPPGPVEKHHGVCALGDVAGDFVEVELHHVGVGIGKRQGRSDAPRWADRAEQIGVVVALIGGLSWSRPRLAHWRTRPFFWPIRASSWNQISIGVVSGNPAR